MLLFASDKNLRPFMWLLMKVGYIVENRNLELTRSNHIIRRDYLQLLIEAHSDENIENDSKKLEYKNSSQEKKLTTGVSNDKKKSLKRK